LQTFAFIILAGCNDSATHQNRKVAKMKNIQTIDLKRFFSKYRVLVKIFSGRP
jgi:hypothetical protein